VLHQVEDESGQVWYVGKDDPCHKAIQKLHTLHYTWVVLPRALIRGHHVDYDWKDALRTARRLCYNSQGGRRHIRLAECLRILEG